MVTFTFLIEPKFFSSFVRSFSINKKKIKKMKPTPKRYIKDPKTGDLHQFEGKDLPSFLVDEELNEDYKNLENEIELGALDVLDRIYSDRCEVTDPVLFRKRDLLKIFDFLSNEENFNKVYSHKHLLPYIPQNAFEGKKEDWEERRVNKKTKVEMSSCFSIITPQRIEKKDWKCPRCDSLPKFEDSVHNEYSVNCSNVKCSFAQKCFHWCGIENCYRMGSPCYFYD